MHVLSGSMPVRAQATQKKTFHYACSKCGKVVPSRFLFDERLFDSEYFQKAMRESRERAKRQKEETARLMYEPRLQAVQLTEVPDFDAIPGLMDDLNAFVGAQNLDTLVVLAGKGFSMDNYKKHILAFIGGRSVRISHRFDHRQDKIRRFITVIFMFQEREVSITQYGADILIERAVPA